MEKGSQASPIEDAILELYSEIKFKITNKPVDLPRSIDVFKIIEEIRQSIDTLVDMKFDQKIKNISNEPESLNDITNVVLLQKLYEQKIERLEKANNKLEHEHKIQNKKLSQLKNELDYTNLIIDEYKKYKNNFKDEQQIQSQLHKLNKNHLQLRLKEDEINNLKRSIFKKDEIILDLQKKLVPVEISVKNTSSNNIYKYSEKSYNTTPKVNLFFNFLEKLFQV